MKKYLPLLILPFLASCGPQEVVEVKLPDYPVYCIRDAIFLDDDPQGNLLLDMPGWYHGYDDKMQEISREAYNNPPISNVPACQSDDPRMEAKPAGIAWADGRDTDLDGNPL